MAVAIAVLAVLILRVVRRRRAVRAAGAMRAVDAGLGPTVDLVTVVIGGGGTVRQAIETVAQFGPEPIATSFSAVLARTSTASVASTVEASSNHSSGSRPSYGLLFADAIAPLSDELGRPFHPLVGALLATERDGAPVSLLLQRLADDAEQARRWHTESMAKRLPVTLLVPLVVCLLPATIVGALVPLAVIALRELNV